LNPEPREWILEAENLAKNYGSTEAVRGIDLAIGRGEFFGLLGPNGAGKTTTLGMLAGVVEPSRGGIRIGGLPARRRSAEAKAMLGLVPQDFAFYPSLSALDNLRFFGAMFGLKGQRLAARIDAVLAMAGLAGREQEPVAQFSGGMKRRLNIAIGMLHEPQILILDEPTVGVDAQSRGAILETLQELNRQGLTVIYSTHYMEEAQRLCGRVAIMDHGRLVALASPQDLTASLAEGIVELHFAEPVPPRFLESLKSLQGQPLPDDDPRIVRVAVPRPDANFAPLLAAAHVLGIPLRSVRLLEPGLEAAFLKLTGRELRD
jgi:ABC-2 type transport system ATP-binding protein